MNAIEAVLTGMIVFVLAVAWLLIMIFIAANLIVTLAGGDKDQKQLERRQHDH